MKVLIRKFKKTITDMIIDLIRYGDNSILFYIRRYYYSRRFASCGVNFKMMSNAVILQYDERIAIGDNVTFMHNAFISPMGGLSIGNNVSIGQGVSIHTTSHQSTTTTIPMRKQGLKMGSVNIGSNVWLGARVIILYGVSIGDNVIIGAGSLVNRNIPSNCVVAGVPARVIRNECRVN